MNWTDYGSGDGRAAWNQSHGGGDGRWSERPLGPAMAGMAAAGTVGALAVWGMMSLPDQTPIVDPATGMAHQVPSSEAADSWRLFLFLLFPVGMPLAYYLASRLYRDGVLHTGWTLAKEGWELVLGLMLLVGVFAMLAVIGAIINAPSLLVTNFDDMREVVQAYPGPTIAVVCTACAAAGITTYAHRKRIDSPALNWLVVPTMVVGGLLGMGVMLTLVRAALVAGTLVLVALGPTGLVVVLVVVFSGRR